MYKNNINTEQKLKIIKIDLINAIVTARNAALNLERTYDTNLEISYQQSNHFINPSQGRDLRLLIDEYKRKLIEEKPGEEIKNQEDGEIHVEKEIKDNNKEGEILLKLYGRLFLNNLDSPIQLIFKKTPDFLKLFQGCINDVKKHFSKEEEVSLEDIVEYFEEEAKNYSGTITNLISEISEFNNKTKPILDLLKQLIGYCDADKKAREDENLKNDAPYLNNYFKYAESLSILKTGFDLLDKMDASLVFILEQMNVIQTYYKNKIQTMKSISQGNKETSHINNIVLPNLEKILKQTDQQLQDIEAFAKNLNS